jgi:hypothetical protein
VPRAVASLVETTKQLQEMLRLWSMSCAAEQHVSDVYVRLGAEFNSTVVAFQNFGIDLRCIHTLFAPPPLPADAVWPLSSEIYQIPQDLRTVLEGCLSEDPSAHALNKYLPRVRQIIATLLRGLQSKQAAYWHAVGGASMRR